MNDRFLEDLKSRVDLVEIVRKYADVKKSGKNFSAKSPFRNEKTPSFSVSPEKQLWYDFGASEGGDVISFIEKIENFSFQEAVEHLSDMAGVQVPKSKGKTGPTKTDKKNIFDLHQAACTFFSTALSSHAETKKYLANRGITSQTIKDWQLGFGGIDKDGLTKHLLKSGFPEGLITQSGVAFERDFGDKTMRDRFFERLIIPIFEPRNSQIIAFGGRDLSGKKNIAKYVNSPENPVYHKSSTLFGLERARKIIPEKDSVILVEGYFDVIAAHQAGFQNTVATCGTALTEDHLRVLRRLTKNIYLAFDSDMAGKKATLRSVEMCLNSELNPFIINITEGKDFDELARADIAKLKKNIKSAKNALEFFLNRFAEKNLNGSIDGEKRFLEHFFFFLKLLKSPLELDHFLSKISQKINRPKDIIASEFQRFKAKNPTQQPTQVRSTKKANPLSKSENFVGLVCSNKGLLLPKITDETISLLPEGPARDCLEKQLKSVELSKEEQIALAAWEIHQENLYEENATDEIIEKDFQHFVASMKKEVVKKQRLEQAQELREKL